MNPSRVRVTLAMSHLSTRVREDLTERYEGYSPDRYLDANRKQLRAFIGKAPDLGLAKAG